ncbi:ABC transporter substrate-binding protein [Peribacillus alkalitolerans]|uniref:ABC transporter substrate-binding protein n=1 Tax=Peribacillus alkalitolerans TaxID=1550385 RepID=UPI0013D07FAB|nr:ABC transporter substrate-binding protein [Peribacillus alkalitolerans]
MKSWRIVSVLLLSLMVFLAACSSDTKVSKDADKDSSKKQDTLVYGIDGDPGNAVNVITTGDRYGLMTVKAIYSPLYMYNSADDVEYFLAESMTPSEDFLTYTAKLRKDVKWHDGQPFTADDVVFTFEQMLNEANGGWARGQLVFNGTPLKVKKVDDFTVKFTLPNVSMSAMEALGGIFIMPKHVYEGEANIGTSPKNANPIGTGPYKFKEYKAGESLTFEKNGDYFLGAPSINKVVFRIIADPNTAGIALQKGELDALAVSPFDVKKYESDSKLAIKPYEEGRVGYMAFNLNSKTVQDKAVREAISYALNRDEMIQASYISNEYAEPAYSFLPRKATYYTEDVNKHDFNIDQAKGLLGDKKVNLKLAYVSNNPFYQKQAAVMQQNLKAAGINLELVGMDAAAMFQKLETKHSDFDMFLNGYIMGIDPDSFNSLFVTGSPANYMHYSNAKVDELFNQGRVETDEAKRQQIYEVLQKTILEDAVFYPITENKRILAVDANLTGIDGAGLVPVYTFGDMSKLLFK